MACLACAVAVPVIFAPAAKADFGFRPGDEGFKVTAIDGEGEPASLAGSHPFELTTNVHFKLGPESPDEPGLPVTDGDVRDIRIDLPPGLIENPSAVPQCTQVEFHTPRQSPYESSLSGEDCPADTQIGVVTIESSAGGGGSRTFGVFNLVPPAGFPSQFGFSPYATPITLTPHVREGNGEYGLTLELQDFPQRFDVYGFKLTTWGVPWSPSHDAQRGDCLNEMEPDSGHSKCSPHAPLAPQLFPPKAYLTLPSSCGAPLEVSIAANSWQQPSFVQATSEGAVPLVGCDATVPFNPFPQTQLATDRTTSASGLVFTLDGEGGSLVDPGRRASSQTRKAVIALPEGMTINPSVGSGLGVCTPSQYAAETVSSPPGAGCPNASKIGELEVETPLLEGTIAGSLFLAQPDDPANPGSENPFDSMLALYMVAKSPERGILIRLAGKVSADPSSGRLTATFDGLPQLPYTHFRVRFRDGQRSPLATPSSCGTFFSESDLTPWRDPTPRHYTYPIELKAGIGGGPCPNGTVPGFHPQAVAGTLNRNAGSYTPFYLHLTRTDGEQEITSYSTQLPPGLLGKLKGVPYCPEAAIEAAKLKSGFVEHREPSCPDASLIGHTYSGYGLGSVLAYAPGNLYLAGPYHGAPFSIVAVNSATVGPFDLGTIIVRSAIRVDPRTAQVSIDAAGSDPIPHIVAGIPLHLRDVRVYIDRPSFTVNPTRCDHFSVASSLNGSGPSFSNPADDSLAQAPAHFQVSNCSALPFKPRMSFKLRGGTRRGDYPSLVAVVRPRPGDANIGAVSATLPPSEFLAQEHIGTICTRRQFDLQRCPAASVYGHAKAVTPLLGQPLEGPVVLRASDNKLPDLVADISGAGVRIEVAGRIDSVGGGLRGTFDVLPDAPVTKFAMTLDGGKKGLLVNSENVCRAKVPGRVRMVGQNNTGQVLKVPLVNARCRKGVKK